VHCRVIVSKQVPAGGGDEQRAAQNSFGCAQGTVGLQA
jgi:hypothetical protein